jgi:hypothetical protein
MIADYLQPIPNCSTKPTLHRIVLLVYEQKEYRPIEDRRVLGNQFGNRNEFNLGTFCSQRNLQKPQFGNFFTTQYDNQVDKAVLALTDKPSEM